MSLKTSINESINKKKYPKVGAYFAEYSDYWLCVWSGIENSASGICGAMDFISGGSGDRLMDVARTSDKKGTKKKSRNIKRY